MNRETLRRALEAEGTESIECPVCGDNIPAYELATDHAHPREQLKIILDLLENRGSEPHNQRILFQSEGPTDSPQWGQINIEESRVCFETRHFVRNALSQGEILARDEYDSSSGTEAPMVRNEGGQYCSVCGDPDPKYYFGVWELPEPESGGEHIEKGTGIGIDEEGEFHDDVPREEKDQYERFIGVSEWTGEFIEYEYWECEDCFTEEE